MDSEVGEKDILCEMELSDLEVKTDHVDEVVPLEVNDEVKGHDLPAKPANPAEAPETEPACASMEAVQKDSNEAESNSQEQVINKTSLLQEMTALKERMDSCALSGLSSSQLVEIHSQLNLMMSNVVLALKSQCQSSQWDRLSLLLALRIQLFLHV